MADGTSKPIEKVKTGDQVLATDPEIGEQGPRTVLATIVGTGAKTLVEITVDATTEKPAAGDSDREGTPGPTAVGDTVIATDGHPFWVPELGQWVAAIDLTPGMWLQTSAGTWVQITAIQTWTQAATVHNLTVQGTHTYHVLAGTAPLLSHNCGGIGDEIYEEIDYFYGSKVASGVDYNHQRMCPVCNPPNEAADHSIAGIGDDPRVLAEYLSGRQGNATHFDPRTNAQVSYDAGRLDGNGRGVVIIENSHFIHAYHLDPADFNRLYSPLG
ncbi:hypothetical protein NI17_005535 [Thermobifida halotolerans]|uniref:Intein C-terminal splicing domain-containing protein n=2 Tax=Thermobifida halotolerans TaxID=483545 RepID=A0AA97LZG0_9ACTN